jgi:uncharacterized protein YbjT (DUF2867 family)
VIGGTGLIGAKRVMKLREAGHDAVSAAPESGVDTYTGKGLEQAFEGARVVVDVSNAPVWDDGAVLDFFRTTARNTLAAEAATGAPCAPLDRRDRPVVREWLLPAKLAQEEAVRAASVPTPSFAQRSSTSFSTASPTRIPTATGRDRVAPS